MTSNIGPNTIVRSTGIVLGLALLTLAACSNPPGVNVFAPDDELTAEVTTASRDGFLAEGVEPTIRRRDYPETSIPLVRREVDSVPHYPLWWEDPFEDQGDMNDTFAWTWQDYFAGPYSMGRFLLNSVCWPASAVVSLPGTTHVSNGQLYVPPQDRINDCKIPHPHDAYPGETQDPTASPDDFATELTTAATESTDEAN